MTLSCPGYQCKLRQYLYYQTLHIMIATWLLMKFNLRSSSSLLIESMPNIYRYLARSLEKNTK
jgi:hypothetical protein